MLKNDRWIRENALKGMLEPFHGGPKVEGTVSFGVSAYGYDMRIADEFRVFQPSSEGAVIDPKSFDEGNFEDLKADSCLVPPNSYVLARSLEYFRIPRDVLAICFGKSTYARCGLLVNVTPLEPEWEGYVTISISNTTPRPVRIHSNEGIAQVLFLGAQELCETSYADKAGKYQAQKNITSPKA